MKKKLATVTVKDTHSAVHLKIYTVTNLIPDVAVPISFPLRLSDALPSAPHLRRHSAPSQPSRTRRGCFYVTIFIKFH